VYVFITEFFDDAVVVSSWRQATSTTLRWYSSVSFVDFLTLTALQVSVV